MTLYIIWNGFDLAHDLKTVYCHYRKFIKENLKQNYKWKIIFDYYPEDYEFWSDIEYNVCLINKERYLSLKRTFSFGLLDDLFKQIHNSFEKFILNRESDIFSINPYFEFDADSYFFSFNYTTVLEDVYKIDKKRITYVHNDISGPALDILYNIQNHAPCIIGHSPIENDYALHEDLLKDKEYADYVKFTTKDSKALLEQKGIKQFLKDNKDIIDKVVFYGFSFSVTDKAYSKAIFDIFDNKKPSAHIFYKVPKGTEHDVYLSSFKERISDCSIDSYNIKFFNCDGFKKI